MNPRKEEGVALRLTEVGPRDGLQNERHILAVEDKVELIDRLVAAGAREVEIGSFVHPRWVPQMTDTDEVAARIRRKEGVLYWGLIPNMRGLERAMDAGLSHVAVVMSASESHNLKNINRTREQSLKEIREIAKIIRSKGMVLRSYISTAFGCPYEGSIDFSVVMELAERLLDLGVEGVSLGDTIGVGNPLLIREGCLRALDHFGVEKVILHLHDTQGLALANALVAVECGIRRLDSSIGGMGGCPYAPGASGNVGSEDVINLLRVLGIDSGYDLDRLVQISHWLEDSFDITVSSKYYRYAYANACFKASAIRLEGP